MVILLQIAQQKEHDLEPISYIGLVRKVRLKLTNKFLSTSPLEITKMRYYVT